MTPETLPSVEISPREPARASVIWLHGLGADGHDFEPIVPALGLDGLGVRFVFPHAPSIPVTINMGTVMPAWYDIRSIELGRRIDDAGVKSSAAAIRTLIAREIERGIPAHNIVLAGFSQGGAMALHVGLRHEKQFAGIMALSCYLVEADTLEAEASAANKATPILQVHGRNDPMVPLGNAEAARDRLQQLGYAVQWHVYDMAHEVCLEEVQTIGRWIADRLKAVS